MKRFALAAKFFCGLLVLFFLTNRVAAQFPPAPGTGTGLPETIEAIDSARVTTRILYITAHPDDESAAVLTYLARGLHAEVALLTLTHGEGGQNALGPEQAPQLGLIRTQELLAATRGYGVKLYFTRARDFGFSKTPEETEKVWGEQVVEDMVRVVREFRPDIVINGWGGVHSGHGHHQASGLLTPKAVQLAADKKFCDACGMIWSTEQILDHERSSENPTGYVLPLDEISPLYGKSWREIGLDAFVNHRTQGIAGFLNSPFLRRPIALKREDGQPLDPASLSVGLLGLAVKKGPCGCDEVLKTADHSLEQARAAALALDWPASVTALIAAENSVARAAMLSIPEPIPPDMFNKLDFLTREKRKLDAALQLAAGVQLFAQTDSADLVGGEEFTVHIRSRCRLGISCEFAEAKFSGTQPLESSHASAQAADKSSEIAWVLALRKSADNRLPSPSAPFPSSLEKHLAAVRPPLLEVSREVHIGDFSFSPSTPVMNNATTSTTVTQIPVRMVPAYTLTANPSQAIEVLNQQRKPFDVFLRVHSYSTKAARISVGLDTPDGFHSSVPIELSFNGIGDQYAKLTVTPPAKLDEGNFTISAYAKRGEEKFSTSLEPLPSYPTILWSEPAQTIAHAFDINVPQNLRVGYITAEGEPIPEALERLGIHVDMLDATTLSFGDLSRFNTIVVGVRAYELRPELAAANQRLLDFVSAGGTLVVQYNRDGIWDKLLPAPYPATIGSPTPRITDENAAVTFLKPDDPLLNSPNKITQADFQNWMQERGLYYWSNFDSRYSALLSMRDPGEKELNGALVYAHYGKGTYIYTGLAFFRELPEGVPGAYRLFVNLLAASTAKQ